jgi:hypothetical protein
VRGRNEGGRGEARRLS